MFFHNFYLRRQSMPSDSEWMIFTDYILPIRKRNCQSCREVLWSLVIQLQIGCITYEVNYRISSDALNPHPYQCKRQLLGAQAIAFL